MLLQKDDRLSLEKAAELLASGNIVILPTDSVYGFSGIVDLKGAEKKDCGSLIRRIKGRDEGKPFIELIS
ncbi:MAG: translation factor Sua5, partial [Treponema sp.]|nr:translation factor Sua5 [Treponema sp.]